MPVIFTCPFCALDLQVADGLKGQKVLCPECRHVVVAHPPQGRGLRGAIAEPVRVVCKVYQGYPRPARLLLIALVVFVASLPLQVWLWTTIGADGSSARPYRTTVKRLIQEFKKDRQRTHAAYRGRWVEITGAANRPRKDENGYWWVALDDNEFDLTWVACRIAANADDARIERIKFGETHRLVGRWRHLPPEGGHIILEDCRLPP